MNKAGYTPVMLAALTAADSADDLEVAQQLLKLGNVDARSRQVTHEIQPGSRWIPPFVICLHPPPSVCPLVSF